MVPLRHMRYTELAARKKHLEDVLKILTNYNLDEVCTELGEINYLLAPRRNDDG
jgi:hypothetical protein